MVAVPARQTSQAVVLPTRDAVEEDLLAQYLPGVLRQDPFLTSFLRVFDSILRPILQTIDAVDDYLDPDLAPAALVGWLATWVGEDLEERLPEKTRRALVREAGKLHRERGTRAGLRRAIEVLTGVEPLVIENTPGLRLDADSRLCINTALLDSSPNNIYIVVQGGGGAVDSDAISRVVDSLAPAHAKVTVRFVDE